MHLDEILFAVAAQFPEERSGYSLLASVRAWSADGGGLNMPREASFTNSPSTTRDNTSDALEEMAEVLSCLKRMAESFSRCQIFPLPDPEPFVTVEFRASQTQEEWLDSIALLLKPMRYITQIGMRPANALRIRTGSELAPYLVQQAAQKHDCNLWPSHEDMDCPLSLVDGYEWVCCLEDVVFGVQTNTLMMRPKSRQLPPVPFCPFTLRLSTDGCVSGLQAEPQDTVTSVVFPLLRLPEHAPLRSRIIRISCYGPGGRASAKRARQRRSNRVLSPQGEEKTQPVRMAVGNDRNGDEFLIWGQTRGKTATSAFLCQPPHRPLRELLRPAIHDPQRHAEFPRPIPLAQDFPLRDYPRRTRRMRSYDCGWGHKDAWLSQAARYDALSNHASVARFTRQALERINGEKEKERLE